MTLFPPPAGGPVIPAGLSPHGNLLTADLDNLIISPVKFCATGIFARMRQTISQSLTNNAENILSLDTVDEDPYGGWNAGSNYWTPPAGCSGWYQVVVFTSAGTAGSDGVLRPVVILNGTPQYALEGPGPASTSVLAASGSAWVYLLGGSDQVQGAALWAGTGSVSTSVTASFQSQLQVSWESN